MNKKVLQEKSDIKTGTSLDRMYFGSSGWISETGNPQIRNHLFLFSFTASQHNAQCRALYTRIVAKGKSKKLALVAVCNKLIKQSFAIAKSGLPYDAEYRSMAPQMS